MEDLVHEKINKFFSKFPASDYEKNTVILGSEDNPKNVFYLKEGFVKMYSISESGKDLTLNIFKPETYFPASWAIANIPNFFFYETMTDAKIAQIPVKYFIDFIKGEPEVLFDLTKRILSGLNGTLVRMDYLLSTNAYTRVAATLLMCAQRFGTKGPKGTTEISLPLTHKEIASLAGLARESTSVEMEKMVSDGLLEKISKNIVIKNLELLKKRSLVYFEDTPLPYTF